MRPREARDMADIQADHDRVGAAFRAYTGQKDGKMVPDAEKIEDESYQEIQGLIGQMEKIIVRLRELHETKPEQGPHEEGGLDTESPSEAGPASGGGSPSFQGSV